MKRNLVVIVLMVFLLVLSSSLALVDEPDLFAETDETCAVGCFLDFLGDGECDLACNNPVCEFDWDDCEINPEVSLESNITEVVSTPASPNTFSVAKQEINDRIDRMQIDFSTLEADLSALEDDVNYQINSIAGLQQQIDGVNTKSSNLNVKLNQFSTGLAGLQQSLNITQNNLTAVNQQLSREKALTTVMLVIFFLILAIGAFFGISYYLTNRKIKIDPQITNYITRHIKQGKKYPHLKRNLLQAGWQEDHIEHAYKTTMKKNYYQYLQKAGVKALGYDKRKVITIAVITIVLIIGIILIVNGSVGKAIEFQRLVDGEIDGDTGKVTYTSSCTPPHILTPDGDDCCLDVDANGLCDNQELRVVEEAETGCTDNNQCALGEQCINNVCDTFASLYSGEGDCSRYCSPYIVQIITSDGETYNLKPREGSYTATGVLEWKVMSTPDHCIGEQAVIPIKIIRKELGDIINEEIITFRRGETKQILINPNSPNLFSLTLNRISEVCPE